MRYQAHRGVSTEYPENTMAAFRAAVEQGYDAIELDPAVTADGELVVLHDRTTARTCRLPSGESINKPIGELTLKEARELDAGSAFNERFRGERIPTLREVLEFSRKKNIPLKIDNKVASFSGSMQEKLFALIRETGAPAHITAADPVFFEKVCKAFPEMPVHYDGPVEEEWLKELRAIAGDRTLTVWIPMKSELTSWVSVAFADQALCDLVKKYAALGLWILAKDEEADRAEALGADIIETTGGVKPKKFGRL